MTKILIDKETVELALKLLTSAHVATDLVWQRHDCCEALLQALEQAQRNEFNPDWNLLEATQESLREHMAEIQRLRQALEQSTEQEPVAWLHWLHGPVRLFMNKDEAMMELDRLNREYPVDSGDRQMKPLYTTPPQRKPLTGEEIRSLWAEYAAKQNGWPNVAPPSMIDIGNGLRFQVDWHESEYQIFKAGFTAAHGITGEKE